jgi:hypothetical protein
MCFSADILGLFSINVGPFSPNVVLRHPLFSINLVPKQRMFSGRYIYHAQDQYAKAKPLYERALLIREKALGPEHPNVAACLNNLARLYRAQGRYGKAEPFTSGRWLFGKGLWVQGTLAWQSVWKTVHSCYETWAVRGNNSPASGQLNFLSRCGIMCLYAGAVLALFAGTTDRVQAATAVAAVVKQGGAILPQRRATIRYMSNSSCI